jgi:hypothetical protein
LDDNNKPTNAYTNSYKNDNGLIVFETNDNLLKIPIARVLKIKEGLK